MSNIDNLMNFPVDIKYFEDFAYYRSTAMCSSPTQGSDGTYSPHSASDSGSFNFPDLLVTERKMSGQSLRRRKNIDKENIRKKETKVKRNERERRRVRRLADGFAKLRTVVPGNYKKLSKLDTLKNAMEYINGLASLLATDDGHHLKENFHENVTAAAQNQVISYFFLNEFLIPLCLELFFKASDTYQGPRSLRARGGFSPPIEKKTPDLSRNEVLTHITPPPPPPPPHTFFSTLLNFLQVIGKTEGIPVVLAFNTLTRIKLKLKYGAGIPEVVIIILVREVW